MTQHSIDSNRVEAFAGQLLTILNGGAAAVMISIGHRTGLFDTLAELDPATSERIAEAAGLNERYVREWLAAMVMSKIVEYDEHNRTYHLPAEHAACLTRAAAPNNLAVFGQHISLIGTVEDQIIECFRNGGGVPYEAYHRFHDVMAEDSAQTVLPVLVDQILPLAPGLVNRLESGIDVLDIGCGAGRAINRMAEAFPNSRFLGVDLSKEAVARGREEARRLRLQNARFEAKDLSDFPIDEQFDLITAFDAIHDQGRPDNVLAGIARALRPDGVFLMQDIASSSHLHNNAEHPLGPFLYTVSCLHCMPVSLAQDGGMGLGTMWGEETALRMLDEAGFEQVTTSRLPHDIFNLYITARPKKQLDRATRKLATKVA